MLEDFLKVGRGLLQEHLVYSHGGSLSICQDGKIFITAQNACLAEITPQEIIEVKLDDTDLPTAVSRQLNVHRAIYKQTGAGAIVQAHPPYAIAISMTDNKIVPQDSEGLFVFKSAAIVRVREDMGADAARLLPSFLTGGNLVAVLKGFGSFAIGKSLVEAYRITSALENSCRINAIVRSCGSRQNSKEKNDVSPHHRPSPHQMPHQRSAIPPGIGVMGRRRYDNR